MRKLVKEITRTLQWQYAETDWVTNEGLRIQQIPAPTFHEQARTAYIEQRFADLGLTAIETDGQGNVYGVRRGTYADLPAVMISAHLDTVFDAETDLKLRHESGLIYGPGLGDNSMGVAGMLGAARHLHTHHITPDCDIWFVATTCEEGLGDLKGMRHAFRRLQEQVSAVINLEGLAFGHVFHAGIAVHRLHITAKAEGGHSWVHFGRPSAVHAIMQLGAKITRMHYPMNPRTTYNIGMLEGGQAINAIATSAGLWLDLRSEDQYELEKIRQQVYATMQALNQNGLTFHAEVVGSRPAGRISPRHALVQGALAALAAIDVRGTLETGSTDGNIPLAEDCPTVTIGITRGGNAHRLDEYIETKYVHDGMRQLMSLLLATCQYHHATYYKVAGD